MNWDTITALIAETAPLWGTALVSMVSVVVAITKAINGAKDAIEDMKADKTLTEIRDQLATAISENERLIRQNNVLIDRIKQVEQYMEAIK